MAKFNSPTDAILGLTKSVAQDWTKQRKAEERNARAQLARHDRLVRYRTVTIREAAYRAMPEAYALNSDNGRLPVRPRQVMYKARPTILEMTGRDLLDDAYFTQTLLPDYIEEHGRSCASWDIIWDARGHFREPHTGRSVPIGTLEVRQYVGERPQFGPLITVGGDALYPTSGPKHRYRNVLFIEKEGFDQILAAARIQERFDIAVMSTKGMSVTAARLLLDRIAPEIEKILVLHDFDIAGFSIFGTLASDSRRYKFANRVKPIDMGLRLVDVERLALESEPVPRVSNSEWAKRRATLARHGATPEEIDFLREQRVEINSMTSPELITFLENKFEEYDIKKIVPDIKLLNEHARHLLAQRWLAELVEKKQDEIERRAADAELPADLGERVRSLLAERPELSWDRALAELDLDIDDEEAEP